MKKFKIRPMISLGTAFLFFISLFSGLVLYFTPQGRVAYWIDWRFLALTKTDWTNIHILTSVFFFIFAVLHFYYNWNAFIQYLYKRACNIKSIPYETFFVTVLTIFILISALYQLPPLKYIITFSDILKKSWVKSPLDEPPIPHAESMSLQAFCVKQGIELEKAISFLREKGIEVSSPRDTLKDISSKNGLTPAKLYALIKPLEKKEVSELKGLTVEELEAKLAGRGIGRKTLKVLAEELGFNFEEARENLRKQGINFKEEETLKEIAERYQKRPIEILAEALSQKE